MAVRQDQGFSFRFKRAWARGLVSVSNRLFGKDITHRSRLIGAIHRFALSLGHSVSSAHREQARFERENPEAPWFAKDSLPYLESVLQPEFVGFEWGSGRSSVWFGKRVAKLTSVEGRADWRQKSLEMVRSAGLGEKVDVVLCEVTTDHDFDSEEKHRYIAAIDSVPDRSLDFVVVDGHFRLECLDQCLPKLKPGGILILDNAELPEFDAFRLLHSTESTKVFNNRIWETVVFKISAPQ